MTRFAVVAVVVLMGLAGCTTGLHSETPEGDASDSASTDGIVGADPEEGCIGRATASVNGKPARVRIEVMPCRVVSGEAPRAVLTNVGDTRLGYGPGFKLERKTDRGWRWVNRRQAFPLPLFYLAPGEKSEPESLAVFFATPEPVKLKLGVYRVTKGLLLTPGKPRPPMMEVQAAFRVNQ